MKRWLPHLAFLGSLQFYLYHLAPGCGFIDAPRYAVRSWLLDLGIRSIDHPGFALAGQVAMRLPLGNLAYRLGWMTALFGALCVAAMAVIARRFEHGFWPTAAACAGLATGWSLWWSSTEAEVYTLNGWLTLLVVDRTLRFGRSRSVRELAAAGFLLGLGLLNHAMIVLIVPALLLFLALQERSVRKLGRALGILGAAAGVGLLPYLFLVGRELGRSGGAAVLLQLSGGEFRGAALSLLPPGEAAGYAARFALILLGTFDWWQLPLAGIGLVLLVRRRCPEAVLVLGSMVTVVIFVINYQVPDRIFFYLPAVLLAALGVSECLETLSRRLRQPGPRPRLRQGLLVGILALALLTPAAKPGGFRRAAELLRPRYPELSRRYADLFIPSIPGRDGISYYVFPGKRHERSAAGYRRILEAVPREAVLVDDWYHGYAVLADYYQRTLGIRRDVRVIRWFERWGGDESERERRLGTIRSLAQQDEPVLLPGLEYPNTTLLERLGPGWEARREHRWYRLIPPRASPGSRGGDDHGVADGGPVDPGGPVDGRGGPDRSEGAR